MWVLGFALCGGWLDCLALVPLIGCGGQWVVCLGFLCLGFGIGDLFPLGFCYRWRGAAYLVVWVVVGLGLGFVLVVGRPAVWVSVAGWFGFGFGFGLGLGGCLFCWCLW